MSIRSAIKARREEQMTWLNAVQRAIAEQEHLPYGRSAAGSDVVEGATERIDWRGVEILRQGDAVSCVYTVYETFLTAMKMLELESEVTTEDIEELKRRSSADIGHHRRANDFRSLRFHYGRGAWHSIPSAQDLERRTERR